MCFTIFNKTDWYLTLEGGERVLGCACGDAWSAVVTSRRFLRVITSGGNQDRILWLNGDPVTIVGRERLLAVVYHDQQPLLDGTQKLGYILYDAITNRALGKGTMSCISPRSSLEWIGFSAELSLVAMDTKGMLSMLIAPEAGAGWEWIPVLDTNELRRSEADRLWPISVMDGKLNCVPLKGGTKYPNAARRPVTANIALRMPFVPGSVPQTRILEELSVRAIVALQQKRVVHDLLACGDDNDERFDHDFERLSAQVDKITLKMFSETVKAEKLEKALDLVERLHVEKSFDLAIIFAGNNGKLVRLIEGIKCRRFGGPPSAEFDLPHDMTYEEQDAAIAPGKISPEPALVSNRKRQFGSS